MRVESCSARAHTILRPAISGHCHELYFASARQFPDTTRDLITIHFRQADIEQDHIGLERFGARDRLPCRVNTLRLVPLHAQKHGKAVGRVGIVVNDQYTPARHFERHVRAGRSRDGHDAGQPDLEARPMPRAVTRD